MLALAILGLLMSNPLHGYEIRKELVELLGFSGTISYGSLYPTLAKLHHQNLIISANAPESFSREPIYSTGSLNGDLATQIQRTKKPGLLSPRKNKKVYSITEKGAVAFTEKLQSSFIKNANDDRAFVVHLTFLDMADDQEKDSFFQNRINALGRRLNNFSSSDNQNIQLFNDVQRSYINNQIEFLSTLRQKESKLIS